MKKPPIPPHEADRLAALHRYEIVDTLPEQEFDDLTLLAAEICGTPIALISLVDSDRQWFKARVGLDATSTHRDLSFCGHVVADEQLLMVSDATQDDRFADNPLVLQDPSIRFYAGAPLVTPDHYILGTLCVIDQQPRSLSDRQVTMLEALSRQVVSQLELRRSLIVEQQVALKQRLFFNHSLDLLCIIGFDDYFKELNSAWERILGYSTAELLAHPFTYWMHEADQAGFQTIWTTLKQSDFAHQGICFECRYRTQTGDDRWLAWSAAVPDDHHEMIIASARDVTEQKQAARELELAKHQAEEANTSKSVFLANMSHELRTPLNSVIGFTNLLLKNKAANLRDQDLQYLDRILVNGKHLLSLLNDVLDLSKIEADRLEFSEDPLDLCALLQDVVDSLDNAPHSDQLTLQAVLPDHPVKTVLGDRRRTQQVLLNLLGNAIKFTEKGVVEVSLVLAQDGATPLRINVSDSGIGIPADKLDLIFEAFRQADDSTSRRYGGTGLGLPISQSMCRAQGWMIEVASRVGEGSTFSIRLQQEAPPLQHRTPHRSQYRSLHPSPLLAALQANTAVASEATILVIDDDADARTLLERYAQDLGCRVIGVSSGDRGIELARSIRPTLITLDLCMPGVNGFEVLRILREDPELRNIPVVVCSIIGEENRASLVGAVEILDKPVNPQALSDLIQTYMDPHNSPHSSTVLIVDDDPTSRELLSAILEEWGLNITCAANGQEGLKAIETQRPDLVLLDLMMPVLDGFSFIDQLRRQPQYLDLPVIICSAKELTPQERAKLNDKAQQVVSKGESLEQAFQSILPLILHSQHAAGRSHEPP